MEKSSAFQTGKKGRNEREKRDFATESGFTRKGNVFMYEFKMVLEGEEKKIFNILKRKNFHCRIP